MKTNNSPAVVAKRTTFDGVTIYLHEDGQLSDARNFFRGRLSVSTMWRLAEDICLYTHAEIPQLLRDIKSGVRRGFRVYSVKPAPANAVYETILLANGNTSWIRIR